MRMPTGCLLSLFSLVSLIPLNALAQGPVRPPNVVLITVDTLRADHISSYGYHRLTTPHIDQLAREGVRFHNAYTTVPYTGPAHISMFTGRHPQEHGAKVNGQRMADDPRLTTLAQYLKARGYRTAAFVSAWPLKAGLTGLDAGFDVYDEDFDRWYQMVNTYRSAEDLNPKAIRWMQSNKDVPFFLWVHYFEPHAPYQLRKRFEKLESNPAGKPPRPAPNKRAERRIHRYDSEVAYTDHHVGQLLAALEQTGKTQSTIVALTADHGESLGEHGYVGHGRNLYEPTVRIPLILRYPAAVPAGRVVNQPVSVVDLLPTFLDFSRVQPLFPLPGANLRAHLNVQDQEVEALVARPVYFVTFAGKKWQVPGWLSWLWYSDSRDRLPHKLGQVAGGEKLVWTPAHKRLERIDLLHDPGEVEPTHDASVGPVQMLQQWFHATAVYLDQPVSLSQRDREALRSLGYVVP